MNVTPTVVIHFILVLTDPDKGSTLVNSIPPGLKHQCFMAECVCLYCMALYE